MSAIELELRELNLGREGLVRLALNAAEQLVRGSPGEAEHEPRLGRVRSWLAGPSEDKTQAVAKLLADESARNDPGRLERSNDRSKAVYYLLLAVSAEDPHPRVAAVLQAFERACGVPARRALVRAHAGAAAK